MCEDKPSMARENEAVASVPGNGAAVKGRGRLFGRQIVLFGREALLFFKIFRMVWNRKLRRKRIKEGAGPFLSPPWGTEVPSPRKEEAA